MNSRQLYKLKVNKKQELYCELNQSLIIFDYLYGLIIFGQSIVCLELHITFKYFFCGVVRPGGPTYFKKTAKLFTDNDKAL